MESDNLNLLCIEGHRPIRVALEILNNSQVGIILITNKDKII